MIARVVFGAGNEKMDSVIGGIQNQQLIVTGLNIRIVE